MSRAIRIFTAGAAVAMLALMVPREAEAQGRGAVRAAVEPQGQQAVAFSRLERELIVSFFHRNPEWRAKPLPRGIRRNLARGKPLPPGIAKQVLPYDLEVTLPVRPGYRRVVVGTDVVLVEVATQLIWDILTDVF